MSSRSWMSPSGNDATHEAGPLDEVVFTSASVTIGAFRCPTWHPAFEDSGPIQNDVFVFPRRAVGLCHEGERPFLADPGVITLYNKGQRYSRRAVSPAGDHCEWFAVERGLLLDAIAHHEPRVRERSYAPFRHAYAPCPARTYLAQRTLFETLRTGAAIDLLRVEEAVVEMLSDVLSSVYAFWGTPREPQMTRARLEAAEHARRLLAGRLGEPLRLADIARAVDMSVFHLCRTFRRATGSSLHAYRNQVRLFEALERLEGGADLTGIGLDLGYSSHSHFTAAFRGLFGVPPSAVRGRLKHAPPAPQRSI